MIELERHIEILLLGNDCVIVPGLGGFMAHHVDACYDDEEGLFVPPRRTLGFNPQLTMNDSLLVQSYIEAYDMSYPEALRRIEDEVSELKQHLETEGSYELNDIGVISLNEEGHYEFEPCEAGILTPALYGLSSLAIPLLKERRKPAEAVVLQLQNADETTAEVTAAEAVGDGLSADEAEETERVVAIKLSWIRNAVAVAAAVVCFFFMTSPISNSNVVGEIQQSTIFHVSGKSLKSTTYAIPSANSDAAQVDDSLQSQELWVTADEQADSIAQGTAEEEPAAQPRQESVAEPSECYVIVLASETSKRNALAFVERLHKEGFDEARMAVTNRMTRVVYGSYASESDAQQHLRELRTQSGSFKEGWVYRLREQLGEQ